MIAESDKTRRHRHTGTRGTVSPQKTGSSSTSNVCFHDARVANFPPLQSMYSTTRFTPRPKLSSYPRRSAAARERQVGTMAQSGSRAIVFATVGFSVGILYSVKTQRDTAKRRTVPSPAMSSLDLSRMCGRWYQVAAIDRSYFQRKSKDTIIHVSRTPLLPLSDDNGEGKGVEAADESGAGAMTETEQLSQLEAVTGNQWGGTKLRPADTESGQQQAGLDASPPGGTAGAGFVPPSEAHTQLPPELYLRRVETLGGTFFGGKQLVTDATAVRPNPIAHPAQFVYTETSGMERRGLPWWVIKVGRHASPSGDGDAEARVAHNNAYGYMVVVDGNLRDNARVLCRDPVLPPALLQRIANDLESRGFVTKRMVMTEQSAANGSADVGESA